MAHLAGRLKKDRQESSLVAVGDWVYLHTNEDGSGTIDEIAERKTVLSRSRPSASDRHLNKDQEQILVANVDQVVFVFAVRNPTPNLRKLDRFLVVAEMNKLTAVICANKIDLQSQEKTEAMFAPYQKIGYQLIYTSTKDGRGVDDLRQTLQNKISVLAGSSGVGKSSLLNAIQPDLGLRVNQVSGYSGKGLHTTRYAELFALDHGGYVADTPGIRGLALYDLEPAEVDAYFREIAPWVSQCHFSDCSHRHEPNCAVLTAVARGDISQARYESYLRLREEHDTLDRNIY